MSSMSHMVKSDVSTVSRLVPVYPDQRTISDSLGTSQKCQERSFIRHAPLNVRRSKNHP